MRRILCSLFGHRRDSRRAHLWNDGWRAPCLLCGTRMAREANGRWRVVLDEEYWPSLAPFGSVIRQPFHPARTVDPAALTAREGDDGKGQGADRGTGEHASFGLERVGGSDRGEGQTEVGDSARLSLGDLFEQAAGGEARKSGDDRGRPDYRREAEIFAIAFASWRDMQFRPSDQFSLRATTAQGSDETPTANR